jgi:transcriptional regulator NrdR family protein
VTTFPNTISQLASVLETERVFCEVETECISIFCMNFVFESVSSLDDVSDVRVCSIFRHF